MKVALIMVGAALAVFAVAFLIWGR